MHGDAALSEEIRHKVFPNSRLKGEANLLVMPTLDAANISVQPARRSPPATASRSARSCSARRARCTSSRPRRPVRRIVNMTALAVADANAPRGQEQSLF